MEELKSRADAMLQVQSRLMTKVMKLSNEIQNVSLGGGAVPVDLKTRLREVSIEVNAYGQELAALRAECRELEGFV